MNTPEPLKRAPRRKWERGGSHEWSLSLLEPVTVSKRHTSSWTVFHLETLATAEKKQALIWSERRGGRCVCACVWGGGDGDDNNECVRRWLHHGGHQGDKRSEPRVARLRIEDESHLHHYGRHPIRAMPVTTCISRWQTFLHSGRQDLSDLTVYFNTLIKWTGLGEEVLLFTAIY